MHRLFVFKKIFRSAFLQNTLERRKKKRNERETKEKRKEKEKVAQREREIKRERKEKEKRNKKEERIRTHVVIFLKEKSYKKKVFGTCFSSPRYTPSHLLSLQLIASTFLVFKGIYLIRSFLFRRRRNF
jgi:ATPase subunit of ABC transporter with duplicated ATPase domains